MRLLIFNFSILRFTSKRLFCMVQVTRNDNDEGVSETQNKSHRREPFSVTSKAGSLVMRLVQKACTTCFNQSGKGTYAIFPRYQSFRFKFPRISSGQCNSVVRNFPKIVHQVGRGRSWYTKILENFRLPGISVPFFFPLGILRNVRLNGSY